MPNYADRVKETTTTIGVGTVNLNGAEAEHQSFVAGFGDGAIARYGILSGDGSWELGKGTVTDAAPDTLSRDTIFSNSNGDTNPITLTGTSTVFSTMPAALLLDSSNNLSDLDTVATARTNLGLVAGGAGDIWVEKAGDTMTGGLTINDAVNVPLILDNLIGTQNIFEARADGVSLFTIKDAATNNVNRIALLDASGSSTIGVHLQEDYTGASTRNLLLLKLRALSGGSGITRGGNYQVYLESAVTGEAWAFVALARSKDDAANPSRLIGGYYRVQIQNNNTPTVPEANALWTEVSAKDGTFTTATHLRIPASLLDAGTGSIGTNTGIWIDDQLVGDTDYGIVLNGDITSGSATVLGGASVYGAGQDASIGYDGTDLVIDPKLVGTGLLKILGAIQVENYHRHISFDVGKAISGPSAPTGIIIGTAGLLRFNADAEVVYLTFEIPSDWVAGTDMTFQTHWVPEAVIADTETVKWDISYRSKADGEAIDGGTVTAASVTYTQSGAGTTNEHITSEITLAFNDANNPLTAGDLVVISFDRDMTGDTFAGDVAVFQWALHFISNTLPSH